uniref:Bruno n=1 Tax=Oopsacas minuta TaxID=111878 RepID=A0A1W5RZ22_9METZ|nr:bruno [Oopsacas minuta]
MAEKNGVAKEDDVIKLFVGQIPKHYEREDIEEIMSEFGEIFEINVIRDKITNEHKGCAFITYVCRSAATNAQMELHEKRTLQGMSHAMQVKPANSEGTPEECKLFIGMISKLTTEEDLKKMFTPFGLIENITVLRYQDGQSKGCAFLKYRNKSMAQKAIKNIHHSQTMPGCSQPVVVKIADTERDKAVKKMQHQFNQALHVLGSMGPTPGMGHMTPSLPSMGNPLIEYRLGALVYHQLLQQQLQNFQGIGSLITNQHTPHTGAAPGHHTHPHSHHGHQHSNALTSAHSLLQAHQGDASPPGISPRPSYPITLHDGMHAGIGQQDKIPIYGAGPQTGMNLLVTPNSSSPQRSGPDGSNLFIYHLPPEFSDTDLLSTFIHFGNIVSAKVFIDKQTSLSKCFGFVSYDNPLSAGTAIQSMNGFQIGNKRLKVQLKKSKTSSSTTKPY